MTTNQLKGFFTIVEKQSFTAAAESLYISQSALSQQMQALERELGFSLFDRSTRRIALTEAGRSFYQSSLKMQELYFHAVSEGQQLQRMHQQQLHRLCIGCLGDQYFQIWMDLLRTALPLSSRYAPRPVRYESKEALYTALLRGEAQIAALLENADIARLGLQFLPFARVPELCMPSFHSMDASASPLLQKSAVCLEDLQELRIAFHHHPGDILYEDELRHYLQRNAPQYDYVDPLDFFTSSYRAVVLLLPAVQYSGHAPTVPLDWQGGARLGFVTAPNADKSVLEYAQYIKDHLQPIPNFWEPLEE